MDIRKIDKLARNNEEFESKLKELLKVPVEEYFNGHKLAIDIFNSKYALPKEDGTKETPGEVWWRLATELAKVERKYSDEKETTYWRNRWFLDLYYGYYRPGGSIITGLRPDTGKRKISLFNCFSRNTKFITKEGIKSFYDFNDGDEVTVLGLHGKWFKGVIRSFGTQQLWRLVVEVDGKKKTIYTTANHWWPVFGSFAYFETADLSPTLHFLIKLRGVSHLISPKLFSFCGYEEVEILEVEPTDRYEEVWCVEVPEWNHFVLADGILTHNCTTIPLKGDSLEAIFKCLYDVAKCAAYRQGIGVDVSPLRPKGTPIANAAEVSDGAVHWMDLINKLGDYVGQKGRRLALLLSLKVSHPDIEEFITCKDDLDKITNANISVQITNDFMEAVLKDKEWELYFQVPEHNIEIRKKVPARKLWRKLAEHMWISGDPGWQFINLMQSGKLIHHLGVVLNRSDLQVLSTNAPVVGSSLVYTKDGLFKIEDLYEKGEAEVLVDARQLGDHRGNSTSFVKATFRKYENQPEYKIELSNGITLYCNDVHKWLTPEGYVETKNLKPGDKILLPSDGIWTEELTVEDKQSDDYQEGVLAGWYECFDIDRFKLPERCYTDRTFAAGFLAGFFSKFGKVAGDSSIVLCLLDYRLVEQISKLLQAFGIFSNCQKVEHEELGVIYRLSIDAFESKYRFMQRVGFDDSKKNALLSASISGNFVPSEAVHYVTIKTVEFTGQYKTMYCAYVPDVHGFVVDGVLSSNCSEEPLVPYGVCNLGSINFGMLSDDIAKAKEELAYIVPALVKLLDNVIDYELDHNLSPLPEQRKLLPLLREIGCGLTNLHYYLLKLGIDYDSDEAQDIVDELLKEYMFLALRTSVLLGSERGRAKLLDEVSDEQFKEALNRWPIYHNLVSAFPEIDWEKDLKQLRNLSLLSIAPTGSISLIFPKPCMSSGIEPVIGWYYWRKTRAVDKTRYIYYFVIPDEVKEFILRKIENKEDYEKLANFSGSVRDDTGEIGKEYVKIIKKYVSPETCKPAHFIDPIQKVKLLSRAYKWVDACISCTFNLPESATVDDVEKIGLESYLHGVRATTIYREGSKDGVLIFEPPPIYESKVKLKKVLCVERPEDILYHCAPKRPKELPCDIHHTVVKGKKWIVLVGKLNGKPYEIFAGEYDPDVMYVPTKQNKGIIIKEGKSIYSLKVIIRKSEVLYRDIANLFMNEENRALTRLVSLALRHGVPTEFIVEQLKKSAKDITDFSLAVARVLSKYPTGIEVKGEKCPNCEEPLVNKEGCLVCVNCGYSKCG